MAAVPILVDRHHPPSTSPPLDRLTVADAFEAACLLRCMTPPATAGQRRPARPRHPATVEFNREEAARRMRYVLDQLDIPVEQDLTVGGLRRRYELHRLNVPRDHHPAYANLLEAGWRQGRRELLFGPLPGASAARRAWRVQLAAAAWRAALLAGGRHVRRHILGIRLADRELAAVLVRGAALLEVPALLRSGTGCFVVSVAQGPDRDRILHSAMVEPARRPAC